MLVIVFLVQSWDLLIGSDAYRTGLEVKSGLESLSLGHARVLSCTWSIMMHLYLFDQSVSAFLCRD